MYVLIFTGYIESDNQKLIIAHLMPMLEAMGITLLPNRQGIPLLHCVI